MTSELVVDVVTGGGQPVGGTGYGAVWWPFAIMGIGYGLLSTPMAAAVLGAVPRDRAGMAATFIRHAR